MSQSSFGDALERALGGRFAEVAEAMGATAGAPAGLALLAGIVAVLGVQRAADMVLTAAGGPSLPAIRNDDRAPVYELLSRAAEARGDARAARAWARRARPGAVPPRRARGQGQGWDALSHREQQVALLAAEGYSNARIGQTLLLSERTVQSHLSRALAALGAPSRASIPASLGRAPGDHRALTGLTARQREVAALVARGASNRAIADELAISEKTVEKHVQAIFARWDVHSRTAIANRVLAPLQR
jgi:DNA-binding NarL/FixJ family response regulator